MGPSRQTTGGPDSLPASRAAAAGDAEALRQGQRSAAIAQVRALMADYGLSTAEVAGTAPALGPKEAATHRGPAPGRTGRSRGLDPR